MHVGIAYMRWQGKRSRHSRRMRTRNFTYLARGPCHRYWWPGDEKSKKIGGHRNNIARPEHSIPSPSTIKYFYSGHRVTIFRLNKVNIIHHDSLAPSVRRRQNGTKFRGPKISWHSTIRGRIALGIEVQVLYSPQCKPLQFCYNKTKNKASPDDIWPQHKRYHILGLQR